MDMAWFYDLTARLDEMLGLIVGTVHAELVEVGLVSSGDVLLVRQGLSIALAGSALLVLVFVVWIGRRRRSATSGPLSDLVRWPALLGGVAILSFVAAIGGWSAVAPLASAAVASGVVSPDGDTRTVQHLEGGLIDAIHVRDGDVVSAGDVLVTLEDTAARASFAELSERALHLYAVEARLAAELADSPDFAAPEAFTRLSAQGSDAILDGQRALMSKRQATLSAREDVLGARVEQLEAQAAGLADVIAAQERQIALLDQEIATARELYNKGLQRLPQVLALEREKADIEADVAINRTEIARMGQMAGETRLQLLAFREERAEEINTELVDTRRRLAEIESELPARRDRLARTIVRAPSDGVVTNLLVNTEAGVVRPGDAVLDIVPSDVDLIVDARVRPTDIDRVYSGMRARIVLTAYRQRNLPLIYGQVRSVSADSLSDDRSGEPYFLARVEIDPGVIETLPDVVLTPGMPVDIMLLDEEQTLAAYLIDPLRQSVSRSFLEE